MLTGKVGVAPGTTTITFGESMLQAIHVTGPAYGPAGRGHVHMYNDGLGVVSNAEWWSTARSGGADGLGAPIEMNTRQGAWIADTSLSLGGAVLGAVIGGLLLGSHGRGAAAAGAGGGAAVVGFGARMLSDWLIGTGGGSKTSTATNK